MLMRNSIYNLIGLGLPLLVAIFSIPILIESLGVSQFGLLTLIWAVVSYFSLFDLGFGRALTQKLSVNLANKDYAKISPLVSTAIFCLTVLGGISGIILCLCIPLFLSAANNIDSDSILYSALAMSFAMPAVILTAGYRGILEATENFKLINAIRLPMGVFTFLGPIFAISIWGNDIVPVAWVLVLGRYFTLLVHIYFTNKKIQVELKFSYVSVQEMKDLFYTGGWMTISNIVSPLMSYIDRFIISATISVSSVTYYVTPQEMLTKLAIFPTAITSVLFPSLAKNIGDKNEQIKLNNLSILAIFIIVLPVVIFLFVFSKSILTIWINSDFADSSYIILQILSVGMFFTCLAQVPFTSIQSNGYSKVTAKIHLFELPLYVISVYLLSIQYGIVGVAIAWTLRNVVDTVIMFLANKWLIK